ncbi:acyl transferase 15-like [Triticum dicoccoides]|uniref:acyl transferase 15-like n=1 Tax=Triticum dicoccoides TaxID=85692 RepID=UPI00188ECCA7|nr:acyl transferase 15-like [Triticum dicoccoides]
MSVIVTKSRPLLVRPSTEQSTPTTTDHIKVSSFDKALAFSAFSSFHVFDGAIHEPAETIKRALSRALDHFRLIAGRVVVGDDDGELSIACTGEGVEFVAATANCALVDVKLFDPPFAALLKDLAVEYPLASCRVTDPLLLMQVTEFSCGAFVLGVTWNHVVADGTGIALLLRAVGELARGLARPSVSLVTCADELMPDFPPLAAAIVKTMLGQLEPKDYPYLDITVPMSTIGRIKAKIGDELGAPCTVFEAATAVLWQCRSRAIMPDGDPDSAAPLVFAANARRHVGAGDGYYSNCVTTHVVAPPPTIREAAEGDMKDLVKLIRGGKEQVPGTLAGEEVEGVPGLETLFGYSALFVTSWRNLGFEATDFGGGTPARVMGHVGPRSVPACVACLPCRDKDGANMLSRFVKEEHRAAFLAELAKFT